MKDLDKKNFCYVVQLSKAVVCKAEMSELLKCVHVFNDRNLIVGQIQQFQLPQRPQTLNFLYAVE